MIRKRSAIYLFKHISEAVHRSVSYTHLRVDPKHIYADQFQAILHAALDCIICMDVNGCIQEFNAAAEVTFGYSREDVIGREMALTIIPPELRERHRTGLAHYLKTGEGPVLGKRIEIPAIRADGSRLLVELAITEVRSADGSLRLLAILR